MSFSSKCLAVVRLSRKCLTSTRLPEPTSVRFMSTGTAGTPKGKTGKVVLTDAELAQAQDASEHAVNTYRHTVYSNLREAEFSAYERQNPGWKPYADAIMPSKTFTEYIAEFNDIADGSRLRELGSHTLCGRISSRREASSKLFFLDIVSTDGKVEQLSIQAIISERNIPSDNFNLGALLRKGDWISVTGFPGKSKTGELSIVVEKLTLLTPCLQIIPNELTDPNVRFRQRSLDLITNQKHTWDIFRVRTQVFSLLRKYFADHRFVEVETPILWPIAGGATARPFITSSNAFGNDMPLNLRIAPELFLKQLVIGGIERVFELSKVFRNEGIDATHNPEFTSCELYMAHGDYNYLMTFTEDLLRMLVKEITGGEVLSLPQGNADPTQGAASLKHGKDENATVLDFSKPFQRLDVIETLKTVGGIDLPENFNDPEAIPVMLQLCKERGIEIAPPYTNARILDTLIGEIIEPLCVQPTYIINHPVALSPLAKRSTVDPRLTERFELFIAKKEYCNAYSELNHPADQYSRFVEQQAIRNADGHSKDEEAHPLDTPYVESLEYGLPPTGGWGLGVDRLIMLLSRVPHIRDAIYFPIMRPQQKPQQKQQPPKETL